MTLSCLLISLSLTRTLSIDTHTFTYGHLISISSRDAVKSRERDPALLEMTRLMNVNLIYTPGITVMIDVTVRVPVNPVGNQACTRQVSAKFSGRQRAKSVTISRGRV